MNENLVSLDLQPSLVEEARKAAEAGGMALDQFVNGALAEKLAALRTEAYFNERSTRAEVPKALDILARAGRGEPPRQGDELPN
ncbi:MAG: hypothetical protein ACRYGP_11855 [Janthinobacterium lividum]